MLKSTPVCSRRLRHYGAAAGHCTYSKETLDTNTSRLELLPSRSTSARNLENHTGTVKYCIAPTGAGSRAQTGAISVPGRWPQWAHHQSTATGHDVSTGPIPGTIMVIIHQVAAAHFAHPATTSLCPGRRGPMGGGRSSSAPPAPCQQQHVPLTWVCTGTIFPGRKHCCCNVCCVAQAIAAGSAAAGSAVPQHGSAVHKFGSSPPFANTHHASG